MIDIFVTIALILVLFVGVPVAFMLAREWFSRPSTRAMQEESRRFVERLHRPDFAAVQRRYGHPLPTCVESLYRNHAELLRSNFEVAPTPDAAPDQRWYVAFYCPVDDESVNEETWPGLEKFFAFADDGFGNGYLIDPREEDPTVHFHDHEAGELSRVCDRFTEFMTWPRLVADSNDLHARRLPR